MAKRKVVKPKRYNVVSGSVGKGTALWSVGVLAREVHCGQWGGGESKTQFSINEADAFCEIH